MRPWALASLWLLVFGYAVRFALAKLPQPPHFSDFNHFYVAALLLRQGLNPYTILDAVAHSLGLDVAGIHSTSQTPTFLLCFEPLIRFSPLEAYWIWSGLSFLAFVLALYLLLRTEMRFETRQLCLFSALVFIYPAVYEHLVFANAQTIILLLIVVAMYCLRRGSDAGAGLALALATALKAYPWVFAVYLLCLRRWRALIWMIIAGAAIGLLTLWGVGLASFSFLNSIGTTAASGFLAVPGIPSLDAAVSRLFWSQGNVALTPATDLARRGAIAIAELAVFALTIAATASARPDRRARAFSLWVPAMILLSPYSDPHYLIMLVLPFAVIADATRAGDAPPRAIYAAIASYLLTFSRYPLTLLHHLLPISPVLLRRAGEFWFLALALAYLAAYWLATSAGHSAQDDRSSASAATAPASGAR